MRISKRRLGLVMLVAFFCPLVLTAQTVVEEHWSPYNYPREIPAGTKFHIVADGDTLWAITQRYLGDPLLWPQVYAQNSYILDPNLIYPGDPVFLDIGVVVGDQVDDGSGGDVAAEDLDADSGEFASMDEVDGAAGAEDPDDTQGEEDISNVSEVTDFGGDSSEFVILPAGDRSDMECSTYIYALSDSDQALPFDIKISGGEVRSRTNFGAGDVVYINKGLNHGVEAGALYGVRRELNRVSGHDGKVMGVAIEQVGKVKILAAQPDSAVALVLPGCYNMQAGDFLAPYQQEPIPLITELPPLDRFAAFDPTGHGYIVYSEDNLRSFGKNHLTNIDMGIDKNIAPGDLFIIFRDNPANETAGVGLPPIFLGHGVALKTDAQSTVMKIITGVSEITVGDKVVPLATAVAFD